VAAINGVPQGQNATWRLRGIPDLGICGANLESLQNAAFPFASRQRNQYRLARITEGLLP
jgi:hypothetical protein